MLKKIIIPVLFCLGYSMTALAGEVFEWHDPTLGNYPRDCSAVHTYGTGGGGHYFRYLYDAYSVSCPSHPTIKVEVYQEWNNGWHTCDIYTNTPGYTMAWNNCGNWRVYTAD